MEGAIKGRFRFSLRRFFVWLTFFVLAASHLYTSYQLYSANRVIAKLHRETGYLEVTNPAKIHVVSVPVLDQQTWRWRVFIPPGANYWFAAQVNDVPLKGFPETGRFATLLPGEWIVEARIHEDSAGKWTINYNARSESSASGGHKSLEGVEADWLDGGWTTMTQSSGTQQTDAFEIGENVLLLRLRSAQKGVGTAGPLVCRGVMLWLSPE